ncbi:MAG TPA: tRNA preQ1(34) S-adenosylmethionine ribosyltransferase-isomerase QueA [Methanosarcinales archaeon]|nr:tRNA preQ1(34) S-adenosylmethionine ribosyltransferase-isomerase QueA [Methanosarcinales archaeon]
MKLSDFDYYLPKELIAQKPIEPRDSSKLMVLCNNRIKNDIFHNIINYINKGDTLVLNNTRVIPARLFGRKGTGGKIEVLLVEKINENTYHCLVRGKKVIGKKIFFDNTVIGTVKSKVGSRYIIEFECKESIEDILKKIGKMPIPPYIKESIESKDRYQTIYASENGSIAAPTAGLHFTKELLDKIRKKGVNIAYITLHIGIGTFTPVRVENISDHKMEAEYYIISEKNANLINNTEGKLIAVGTTTVKALESAALIKKCEGWSDLFIYPPYKFTSKIEGLITNFHLPKSTLLMLVSAFAGKERILEAYKVAIKHQYRFYSFGDAMLIFK